MLTDKDSVIKALCDRAEQALSPRTSPAPEEYHEFIAPIVAWRQRSLQRQTTQDGDHAHR